MLFSEPMIAEYINKNFEPVWESVRPVPVVNIDFGNGQVITRTLHGNIATYVCGSNGAVLDILPGIYEPKAYLAKLDQLRLLSKYISLQPNAESALYDYHEKQANSLSLNDARIKLSEVKDYRKITIESPVKIIMAPAVNIATSAGKTEKVSLFSNRNERNNYELNSLLQDTENNEKTRRLAIHERLAKASSVQPNAITKWLYKNVLHADLDDPYLGLGPTLFSSYPFKDDATGHDG